MPFVQCWLPLLCAALIATSLPAGAKSVDALLEAAAQAIVAGEDARALERLTTASLASDATAGVFVLLARLQLRRGDHEDAKASLREALARTPDDAEALSLRGDALRAAGRLDEARASYDAAMAKEPAHVSARSGEARLLIAEGDLAAAWALAPPLDLSTLELRLALADAAAEAGDLATAIAELDQVLEQYPDWAPALVRRGDYHRRQSDLPAAHADLERALGSDRRSAEVHYRRGLLRRDLSDLEAARGEFTRAIGLDPEFAPAFVARGAVYQSTGQHEQALRDFDHALAIDSSHSDALAHKAGSECVRAAFDRCLEAAEAALRVDPNDWRVHVVRGHALLGRGLADAAVEAYGSALGLAPPGNAQRLLAELQRHLRPRLPDRQGVSWRFLAASDVDQAVAVVGGCCE